MLEQKQWEESLKEAMKKDGWILDFENENTLAFCFTMCNGRKYNKDYFKDKRSFVQYDPDQKVNLISTKDKEKLG